MMYLVLVGGRAQAGTAVVVAVALEDDAARGGPVQAQQVVDPPRHEEHLRRLADLAELHPDVGEAVVVGQRRDALEGGVGTDRGRRDRATQDVAEVFRPRGTARQCDGGQHVGGGKVEKVVELLRRLGRPGDGHVALEPTEELVRVVADAGKDSDVGLADNELAVGDQLLHGEPAVLHLHVGQLLVDTDASLALGHGVLEGALAPGCGKVVVDEGLGRVVDVAVLDEAPRNARGLGQLGRLLLQRGRGVDDLPPVHGGDRDLGEVVCKVGNAVLGQHGEEPALLVELHLARRLAVEGEHDAQVLSEARLEVSGGRDE